VRIAKSSGKLVSACSREHAKLDALPTPKKFEMDETDNNATIEARR
jgi:hypothetical protein